MTTRTDPEMTNDNNNNNNINHINTNTATATSAAADTAPSSSSSSSSLSNLIFAKEVVSSPPAAALSQKRTSGLGRLLANTGLKNGSNSILPANGKSESAIRDRAGGGGGGGGGKTGELGEIAEVEQNQSQNSDVDLDLNETQQQQQQQTTVLSDPLDFSTSSSSADLPFSCKLFLSPTSSSSTSKSLSLSPSHIVIHITEPCTIDRLKEAVLQFCLPDSTPINDIRIWCNAFDIYAATENGTIDDDCPAFDSNMKVHQFGVTLFILHLKPESLPTTSSTTTNNTSTTTNSTTVTSTTTTTSSSPPSLLSSLPPLKPASEHLFIGSKGARPSHLTDPSSQLCYAAESGQLDVVRRLVEQHFADVNANGIDNWKPIHFAARKGHLPVVTYLLKKEASVDAVTKNQWTALLLACYQGHYTVAEILLTCGAEPSPRDGAGKTPLYYAKQRKDSRMIELLIEFQAGE